MEKSKGRHPFLEAVKGYRWVFLTLIGVCVVTVLFCFQYYQRLYSTIRDESKTYLQEVSSRICKNIDLILADNFNVLYTMASSQEGKAYPAFSDIQPVLQSQRAHSNYKSLMLIDTDGNAFNVDDSTGIFLNLDAEAREKILGKSEILSTTQMINNQEYIIFSVPLNGLRVGGREMIALMASYDPAAFDQVLSMSSFGEKAYSQLITKSGTSVTRPTSKYAMQTGYNIFASIKDASFDDGSSLEKLKADIDADRSDQLSFTADGVHRYMIYTPITQGDWYLLNFVPVQVVNQKSEALLRSTLVICGFISLAFLFLIAFILYTFNKHRKKLEEIAYVDRVTGGNTIQRFYDLARGFLEKAEPGTYAVVFTNIEKFKVLNEQFGRKNCDLILRLFDQHIQSRLSEEECMGRLSADNFCILMQYQDDASLLSRFSEWYFSANAKIHAENASMTLPVTEYGIYVVIDPSLPVTQMIDRARLALRSPAKAIENKLHYSFYDDATRQQLLREKQLEDMMEAAIQKKEFQVYLQPKYHLPEEVIGGAEALVRWFNTPSKMIFPDEFIPLFERNGFIIQLDLYVFEEVCRTLRKWLDHGLTPVKISINCSRMHLKDPHFLKPYIELSEKYSIDRKYLEIELTESIVLENTDQLAQIIETIRSAGFGCSMDDFGSGYSSLNLIRTIPVDTLKLDRIFFYGSAAQSTKSEAVVKNIISMAKALSMEAVAEGIEERAQVEMLKKAGCDYIQGYVFAKPMSIKDFERLLFGKNIE
ncbi:EAL domain-containing protein [Eubacterium sp. 1001713B170207_170306_E7]|uniref:bifunctional diguanylate cyclase/phosphodiesterase n=1 Tax=Eubacterium sp. 1001713B170207_170306_E7 TaxID=2787097 RepID=UPI001897C460|nr:EAL domain-containing protein [Eubacterium sp. 1001713B170207_170306_E7]